MNGKTLILVDIQNDFMPWGALPVAEGDLIVPLVNALQEKFELIVATQDWHPPDHGSFASNHPGRQPGEVIDLHGIDQILWPDHCVQESEGAEFHRDLDMSRVAQIIRKGTDPEIDSYSGFFDNGHRKATGLDAWLKQQGAQELWVAGLATDYCVRFTVIDALALGYKVHLVRDACRGVNLKAGDVEGAIREMTAAGAAVVDSTQVR
jgi:nicotinamidase/pyrazinamidase